MTTYLTREQGYAGFSPEIIRIVTQSTFAQVTTAGWYNNSVNFGQKISPVDQALICYSYGTSSQATALFNVAVSAAGIVTFSIAEADVTLPTIANHIATYTNVNGGLGEDPATAISGGNIQAGLSGTAGYFTSYPGTAANGTFVFKAVNNTNNFASTLSNAAVAQATTYTLPDPGAATANIILSASGSAQTIAGGLTISTGNLGVTAGNVTAGSSGNAGYLRSYPATASEGYLELQAANSAGNYPAIITNASLGQAVTWTLADPGGTTAKIAQAPSALVSNNVVKASGTAGLIVDAGFALHAGTTAAYAGGGTSNAFTTTNMTSASIVTATILTQTNAATIVKAVPGTNTLTVTFSADPGANTTINWISTTAVA